ncbi:uncharacterized protein RMCB_2996 [Mycolicibacterium brisbanense]|uniref:Uncharacterized protein n=1 Tax=Mycolicibacterium brisbanense TaxID=146020 RepID=A0A100VZK6_9MYCO|nr:uncharacterized protein RMCB_2996 [Mycolicibacterium brisbanense]
MHEGLTGNVNFGLMSPPVMTTPEHTAEFPNAAAKRLADSDLWLRMKAEVPALT